MKTPAEPGRDPGTKHKGGRREFVLRLVLVLASLTLGLLLAEAGLRATDYDLNGSPFFRFHPRLGWVASQDWPGVDQIQRHGFRFRDVPQAKPPGQKRLVILGDSFAFTGRAYPYTQSFPGLLDTWLGDDWDVINLAAGGWGTAQQLIALREIGLGYSPDAILLQMFPFNDLCDNTFELAYACSLMDIHRPYFVSDDEGQLARQSTASRKGQLRRLSRLYGILELRFAFGIRGIGARGVDPKGFARWRERRRRGFAKAAGLHGGRSTYYSLAPASVQPESVRRGWRVTRALIEAIAATARDANLPMVGLVIPFVQTFDLDYLARTSPPTTTWIADHGTMMAESMLTAFGVPTISLRERINRGPMKPTEWFSPNPGNGDHHLNRFGHDQAARAALAELRQAGLTNRVPPSPTPRYNALDPRPTGIAVRGLGRPRDDGSRPSRARATRLSFESERITPMVLDFDLVRHHAEQEIVLDINGLLRVTLPGDISGTKRWRERVVFETVPGRNVVRFRFPPRAGGGQPAIRFDGLELEPRK